MPRCQQIIALLTILYTPDKLSRHTLASYNGTLGWRTATQHTTNQAFDEATQPNSCITVHDRSLVPAAYLWRQVAACVMTAKHACMQQSHVIKIDDASQKTKKCWAHDKSNKSNKPSTRHMTYISVLCCISSTNTAPPAKYCTHKLHHAHMGIVVATQPLLG